MSSPDDEHIGRRRGALVDFLLMSGDMENWTSPSYSRLSAAFAVLAIA
jgi:hypothetical protein